MKDVDKGSIKYLIINIVSISIAGIILYPILDLFYTKFITRSVFVYSIKEYIIEPIIFGIIIGICFWLFDKSKSKK